MLNETIDNLSTSHVVDVRRSIIGVICLHFACLKDQFTIVSGTIAKSDNRSTREEVGQWNR